MKVALEVAQAEVDKWLDHKKINERKRADKKDSIEALVNAVSDGDLVLNEKMELVQALKFPFENEQKVLALVYKPRINVKEIHSKLTGVKTDNLGGMITAYIAALTGQPAALIGALDTEDYAIGQAVAIFFI